MKGAYTAKCARSGRPRIPGASICPPVVNDSITSDGAQEKNLKAKCASLAEKVWTRPEPMDRDQRKAARMQGRKSNGAMKTKSWLGDSTNGWLTATVEISAAGTIAVVLRDIVAC